jgi:hypothetical protein
MQDFAPSAAPERKASKTFIFFKKPNVIIVNIISGIT